MIMHPSTSATDDMAAIRAVLADLAACWNRADGAGYGALFTDDADYIDVTGTRTQGGPAIRQLHQILWERFLKGSLLDTDGEADTRLIAPDVEIVIPTGAAKLAGQATAPADPQSI